MKIKEFTCSCPEHFQAIHFLEHSFEILVKNKDAALASIQEVVKIKTNEYEYAARSKLEAFNAEEDFELNLQGTQLEDYVLIGFCPVIKTAKLLETVNLSHNNVSSVGLCALAETLKNVPMFQKLIFKAPNIFGDSELEQFFKSVAPKFENNLKILNTSELCDYELNWWKIFASGLPLLKNFRHLSISSSDINSEAIIEIAANISKLKKLQSFDLSHLKHHIGEAALFELFSALLSVVNCNNINFSHCKISDTSVLGIVKAIEQVNSSTSCTCLDLSNNDITGKSGTALIKAAMGSSSVQQVTLGHQLNWNKEEIATVAKKVAEELQYTGPNKIL